MAATERGKDGINVNVVCPLEWTAQPEQFKNASPDFKFLTGETITLEGGLGLRP